MANITVNQAAATFTQALVKRYAERPMPTLFLQSFFTSSFVPSKLLRISVRRGTEKVAVDVERHTDGRLNTVSYSDEKQYLPPFYDEYIVMNDHELYDNVIGMMTSINLGGEVGNTAALRAQINTMIAKMLEDMEMIRDKQVRAAEVQCSQVLQTGTVVLKNGDNIVYPRKDALNVDLGAGNYWDDAGINPRKSIETMCDSIRKEGNTATEVYDVILGSAALNALLDNPETRAEGDLRRINLIDLGRPQSNGQGAKLHGEMSCGSYNVRIWSYPQYYTTEAGVRTPYIDPKNAIVISEGCVLNLDYALVPQMYDDEDLQTDKFKLTRVKDYKKTADEMHVKSAPLAIPVQIDGYGTMKVLA